MIQDYKLLAGAGASGLAVGVGVGLTAGIFFAKKKVEKKYVAISQKEIAEAKQFYSLLYKKNEYATPESTVENRIPREESDLGKAVDALRTYRGDAIVKDSQYYLDKAKTEGVDVGEIEELDANGNFVEPQIVEESDFDYEEELKNRGSDYPYVITKDEFFTNENEYEQSTLTYFNKDNVLTDEKDGPIRDTDTVVGDDNLLRFGHGSEDNTIVYIRNEKLELEFEVLESRGSYAEQILGYIKHSDHQKVPKFRRDDG